MAGLWTNELGLSYTAQTTVGQEQVRLTAWRQLRRNQKFFAISQMKKVQRNNIYNGLYRLGAGQLERELARDDWLAAPAKEALIFSQDVSSV
jgi:putative AlgH/UPF0301 family transcriptional regulator